MKNYIKNKITVYTPTYNRGYCLHQLYNSLLTQTYPFENFLWLIVDDGSVDDTEDLVREWSSVSPFQIKYIKQGNEGKMAKMNFMHQIINTELCMCVDSDDFLVNNAIEEVFLEWNKVKVSEDIAGLVGLDVYKNENIVGTSFPIDLKRIKFRDFNKYGVKGDKKFIYKTSVLSSYPPYPSFKGEKFPAPGYLYRLIDVDYDLAIINKPLCVVEYLDDGLSKNKYNQFKNVPNSFMFYRQERMRLATSFFERLQNAVHYVSSAIFAKKSIFKNNKFPAITCIAVPFGIALNVYIRKSGKKGVV